MITYKKLKLVKDPRLAQLYHAEHHAKVVKVIGFRAPHVLVLTDPEGPPSHVSLEALEHDALLYYHDMTDFVEMAEHDALAIFARIHTGWNDN